MAKLNVAEWIECTEVEGPGKRFALWVQGCLLRCLDCCNPHMFDMLPRSIVDSDEVLTWIRSAKDKYNIDGVTFLGGEPMLQAKGLSVVASGCKEMGLSVVVFTGYTLKHLQKNTISGVSELLSSVDLLVDGAFLFDNLETKRNWVGSSNQKFHYLSNHFKSGLEFDPNYSPGLEMRISMGGKLRKNGWPFNGYNLMEESSDSK